ncbi:NnrU protein [Marinobacterium nitratireducens]|uniref:NnrU protein n=1 Tax=Marinobacterium nitratireducens TaxID=518897 RepID=A0A917ZCD3_9GAMM|nr:NnrU family protein [Marinobacterium nitratireducens]GGO80236.1 NnrU protein [Marinobacterium nitratireducens]
MDRMLLGLLLFFGVHALPLLGGVRQRLIDTFGRPGYLALFSLGSLVGLWLMIEGYALIDNRILWSPLSFGRSLAQALMPLALILVVAAYLPTLTRRYLRHPMLIGVGLWASVHLLANGDLASTLIFAPFLVYALLDMAFSRPRKTLIPHPKPQLLYDLLALIVGLIAFGALLFGHGLLFGVSLLA